MTTTLWERRVAWVAVLLGLAVLAINVARFR
jgi:hypothetical protein